LGEALTTSFGAPHAIAVLSVLNDKDARELLSALDASISEFVITQSSSVRALPAAELGALATEVFGADRVTVAEDFRDALAIAQGKLPAGENTAVVVSGSITLVGDVLAFVQEQEGDLDGEE
jgi:dihydrofolate synthase/folylpolyglutamate synthase